MNEYEFSHLDIDFFLFQLGPPRQLRMPAVNGQISRPQLPNFDLNTPPKSPERPQLTPLVTKPQFDHNKNFSPEELREVKKKELLEILEEKPKPIKNPPPPMHNWTSLPDHSNLFKPINNNGPMLNVRFSMIFLSSYFSRKTAELFFNVILNLARFSIRFI